MKPARSREEQLRKTTATNEIVGRLPRHSDEGPNSWCVAREPNPVLAGRQRTSWKPRQRECQAIGRPAVDLEQNHLRSCSFNSLIADDRKST